MFRLGVALDNMVGSFPLEHIGYYFVPSSSRPHEHNARWLSRSGQKIGGIECEAYKGRRRFFTNCCFEAIFLMQDKSEKLFGTENYTNYFVQLITCFK